MPKVTAAYREARRDEIIDAALRAFAVKGFQGTSMADVIAETGLSAGAIYGHFAGKKELFAAVASRVLDARSDELDAQRRGGEPLPPGEIIATLLDGMRREPFSNVIVQLWAEAAVDDEIRLIVQGVFHRLRDTVRARLLDWAAADPRRVDGDPEEWATRLAPVVLGLGPGYMVQRMIVDDFDDEAYLRTLSEALPH
ncbi:TetR/AcrR family transcriptional regulator [Agromyces sp. CCNWLW203]|uniref:TetR/AcrR family transcriptional regulator n=1 Tax=Agromyces sp. CCNWLW203 TaxID=3112842 RepID=UPI002F967566